MERPFELDPPTYDALIDWPRRLAAEEPFWRELFATVGARRVLDAACGTGRHAARFHAWGLAVEGADLEPAMIAHARSAHGAPPGLRWTVRSFTEPPPPPPFDVVLCTGNSLALVPDTGTLRTAVAALYGAVRPGGALVLHLLNLWRFEEGPVTWQKCVRLANSGGTRVLLKGIHWAGGRAYISFVEMRLPAEGTADTPVAGPQPIAAATHNTPLLGITRDELESAVRAAAGAAPLELAVFGDWARSVYEARTSPDLILLARHQ